MTFGNLKTVEQAAADLNLSQAAIRAWMAKGRIGYVRLERAVRIPSAEIQRLTNAGFVPARTITPSPLEWQ